MIEKFLQLVVEVLSEYSTKSVFGNIGIFYRGAMFAQINKNKIYIRGGNKLDEKLRVLGCLTYIHEKKQSKSSMNYYDVSELIKRDERCVRELVTDAYKVAYREQQDQDRSKWCRLKNLPNLNHTIERMLKRSGIDTVEDFHRLGAVDCYIKMKQSYGIVDNHFDLLWKLHGALNHLHWECISEEDKKHLIEAYNHAQWHDDRH
jgi:DNA transformation protein